MPGELICEYSAMCTRDPEWVWMGFFKGPIPICSAERQFLLNMGGNASDFISINDEIDGMPAREWLEAMRME